MADRLAAEVDEGAPQRRAHEPLGGFLHGERLLQPAGSDVLAELSDLRLERFVRAQVLLGEEGEHLLAHGAPVRPQQQVPLPGGRQEVVRIAAQERQVDLQLAQELGRHQA